VVVVVTLVVGTAAVEAVDPTPQRSKGAVVVVAGEGVPLVVAVEVAVASGEGGAVVVVVEDPKPKFFWELCDQGQPRSTAIKVIESSAKETARRDLLKDARTIYYVCEVLRVRTQ
jgi:hypothetical protein